MGKKINFPESKETPIMIKQKKTAPKNSVVKLLGEKKDKAVREKDIAIRKVVKTTADYSFEQGCPDKN